MGLESDGCECCGTKHTVSSWNIIASNIYASTLVVDRNYDMKIKWIFLRVLSVPPVPDSQETVKKHGADQVQIWRRSFDIPPPDIEESSEFNPAKVGKQKK